MLFCDGEVCWIGRVELWKRGVCGVGMLHPRLDQFIRPVTVRTCSFGTSTGRSKNGRN